MGFSRFKAFIPSVILGIFACSVVSDALTIRFSQFGYPSSLLFMSLIGMVFVYCIVLWTRLILVSQTNRYILITLMVLIGVMGYILSQIALSRGLNGETSQEIVCGLTALSHTWDGFLHDCFLGYPVRQYVLLALPTHLFGPSVTALHLGVAAIFIASLVVYVSGIVTYGKHRFSVVIYSVGVLGLIFHAAFVTHFLFRFEQSILPFAVSMMVIGAYLHFVGSKNIVHALLMIILLSFAAQMYTPALALIPLGIFVLSVSYKHIKGFDRTRLTVAMVLLVVICGVSFFYRHDVPGAAINQSPTPLTDLKAAVGYLAASQARYPFGTFVLKGSILLAFITLFGFSGWFGRIIGAWAMTILVLSVLSKGYAWYSIDFRLHRSLVMLPVLFVSFLPVYMGIKKPWMLWVGAIIAFGIYASGFVYSMSRVNIRPSNVHYQVIQAIRRVLPSGDVDNAITVSLADTQYDTIVSLFDTLRYFLPGIRTRNDTGVIQTPDCFIPDAEVIVIHTRHPCYPHIRSVLVGYDGVTVAAGEQTYLVSRLR